MPNVRAKVNQLVQLGPEAVAGTAVAATKLLTAFEWTFGLKPTTKQFTGTGRKYPSASEVLTEMSQGKVTGQGDFNQLIYVVASVYGKGSPLSPPVAPAPTTAATGGTVLAGVYKVIVTYVNSNGETNGSANGSVTTTGSTSTITVPSPAAQTGATGWYAYVTQAGGNTYTRQQSGSATAIGTGLTLTAPPTSNLANPPAVNTTGGTPAQHSPSSTVYDWIFNPPITGYANPQTYTAQNGDASDAEQYTYLLFSGFGYSFTRKQEIAVDGDWFSQAFTEGVSLTGSPTEVALLPMTGAQANIYLDTTSAGIGVTQLNDPLKVDFKASGYYGQYWPVNRANASFGAHVELQPKNELKITLQANSTGIAVKGNYLETGARCYVRTDIQGAVIDSGNSINARMKHDMCCFVTDMAEFSDVDGVYAVEYTLQVAEDTAWTAGSSAGTSQILTLTNLLSTL